uniref:SFRICE_026653 n=1 Tax=Spodoptera frugiperda TaxID=7108 RepID=A0A2H1WI11_SPOFR
MTSQKSCIAHTMFTCELTRIENPNEQQLGRKPARHDYLAWSEDPPFLRELYSLFSKHVTGLDIGRQQLYSVSTNVFCVDSALRDPCVRAVSKYSAVK